MENIIKINKLGYNYGEGWILHDLSVEIAQGDFVAVIGPNPVWRRPFPCRALW